MSTPRTDLVTLDDVRAAAARLDGVIQTTPVEPSRSLSRLVGRPTVLKCEHLQRTGSFKIRGAHNRIVQLDADERARGVACASAGNHAQGVALAAAIAGVRAMVFMPADAPLPKVDATRAYGAEVTLVGDSFDDAYAAAEVWTEEHGAVFVPPFDHPDIIAGQGTLGLEIVEQVPEVGTVLVPIGGGGLCAGVAVAVKGLRPDVRIVGVEAAGAASMRASLDAGSPQALTACATIADGIAVKAAGTLTLAHVEALVDDVVAVSDEAISRAVLLLAERAKQVVEPAGAAGLAAALEHAAEMEGTVVVPLCGGNVDPLLLMRILQSGMFEEGRYLVLRTRLSDRPGALSRLLALLAENGANVLAVEHHRLGTRLGVLEVDVETELETRGPEHIGQLVGALAAEGYPVEPIG